MLNKKSAQIPPAHGHSQPKICVYFDRYIFLRSSSRHLLSSHSPSCRTSTIALRNVQSFRMRRSFLVSDCLALYCLQSSISEKISQLRTASNLLRTHTIPQQQVPSWRYDMTTLVQTVALKEKLIPNLLRHILVCQWYAIALTDWTERCEKLYAIRATF